MKLGLSDSLPLFGSGNVILRFWTSMGLIFSTSPIRIPPRAINSSIMRLRGVTVLKIISSTTSFSMIGQGGGLRSLNIFLKMSVSHGFLMLGSMEFMMKLKKALRLE